MLYKQTYYCVKTNTLFVGCCDRHQLDQTSTLGGRSLVEVWCRSLVSQFGRHFIKFTMYVIDMSSKLRPNFDTGGVEVWPKFDRSLIEVWSKFRHWGSKFGRHVDQTSTPTSFNIYQFV